MLSSIRPVVRRSISFFLPLVALGLGGLCQGSNLYFQGFETDASGWYDYSTGNPGATRVAGTVTMPAADGNYYGQISNVNDSYQTGYGGGGYTLFGNTSPSPYPGSPFSQSVDVYINTSLTPSNPNAAAFWIDESPTDTRGQNYYDEHDFALFYNGTTVNVALDNGAANIANITTSGWYQFTETFAPDSNPSNPVINTLSVQTLGGITLGSQTTSGNSNGGTLPSSDLGGPNYLWFTVWQNGFSNNLLNIDDVSADTLGAVPEPATLALLGAGLLLAGAFAKLRRRKA